MEYDRFGHDCFRLDNFQFTDCYKILCPGIFACRPLLASKNNNILEICTLLGYYTVSSGNPLLMFWDNLIGHIFKGQEYVLDPETSVRNYHYWLCNSPEERSYYLLRSRSL